MCSASFEFMPWKKIVFFLFSRSRSLECLGWRFWVQSRHSMRQCATKLRKICEKCPFLLYFLFDILQQQYSSAVREREGERKQNEWSQSCTVWLVLEMLKLIMLSRNVFANNDHSRSQPQTFRIVHQHRRYFETEQKDTEWQEHDDTTGEKERTTTTAHGRTYEMDKRHRMTRKRHIHIAWHGWGERVKSNE